MIRIKTARSWLRRDVTSLDAIYNPGRVTAKGFLEILSTGWPFSFPAPANNTHPDATNQPTSTGRRATLAIP